MTRCYSVTDEYICLLFLDFFLQAKKQAGQIEPGQTTPETASI